MTDHDDRNDAHGHNLYGVPVHHHIEQFDNGTQLHLTGIPRNAQLPPGLRASAEQHISNYMDQILDTAERGSEDAAIIAMTVSMASAMGEDPVSGSTLLAVTLMEAAKLRREVRALTGEQFGIARNTAPHKATRKGPPPEGFEGMPADWWGKR